MEIAIALIVGGSIICAVVYIAFMASRAATARKNSAINVEMDYISGRGYVGAIGKDAYDPEGGTNIGNFHLSYDQITSINANGDWITIIAAGSQYQLKMNNAGGIAARIQENLRRAKS